MPGRSWHQPGFTQSAEEPQSCGRAHYTRPFADEQGESHFEDMAMELTAVDFAPPVAPVWLSLFLPVRQVGSFCVPADWEGSVWHLSPSRQVVVYLSGRAQITASDGMVREFGAAVVLLLEDTTGRGHSSRGVGEPMCHVVVQLPHDPR